MNKMRSFMTSDTITIIVAVISAVMLFLIGNTSYDPVITDSYSVKLTVRNENLLEENNKYLQNLQSLENRDVTMRIQATKKMHEQLKEAEAKNQIIAYIDFSVSHLLYTDAYLTNIPTQIQVALPRQFTQGDVIAEILKTTPETVDVMFDKKGTRTFKLKANDILAEQGDYVQTTPVCEPEYEEVTGPETELNQIRELVIQVDWPKDAEESPNSDFVAEGDLVARDYNGNPINSENLTFGNRKATVSVSILKVEEFTLKEPDFVGEPVEGFALVPDNPLLSMSTSSVRVRGPKEVFADIDTVIELGEIGINGYTDASSPISVDLYMKLRDINPKLELVDVSNTKVEIIPNIEPLVSKEYNYNVNRINVNNEGVEDGTMIYPNVGTLSPPVVIEAVSSYISLLDGTTLYDIVRADIDLVPYIGMEPGIYQVPVHFETSNGYTIKSTEFPQITLTIIEPESEPGESEEPIVTEEAEDVEQRDDLIIDDSTILLGVDE